MYKALIVDDEKPVRQIITALGRWRSFGIDPPFYACDGQSALLSMRELHPEIVFLDIEMPVMNGVEFIKQASIEFPDTIYIVVSGYDNFAFTKIAIKYNVLDYLLKPIVESELLDVLQRAVNQLDAKDIHTKNAAVCNDKLTAAELAQEIKNYLDSHYAEEINLDFFSKKFFFSKEYLSRIYKNTYDVGIYEYVLNIRMSRAKELLEDPSLRIQDIAERLGYSNSNYFGKALKNYYGYAPTSSREKFRTG